MKNKILVTFFFLLIIQKVCQSQDEKKINYGLKLGYCHSSFGDMFLANYALNYHEWEDIPKAGIEAGGAINFNFLKRLSLQAELLYRAKGGGIKWKNDSVFYYYNYGYTESYIAADDKDLYICRYIDIPIILGLKLVKFDNNDNSALQLKVGFENSFLISSNLKTTRYHVFNDEPIKKIESKHFSNANKYLNGYIIGIGYYSSSIFIDFLIIHDFNNAYSISEFGDGVYIETNYTTLSLSLGYWF